MKSKKLISYGMGLALFASLNGCGPKHVHELVVVKENAADCIHDGNEKYYRCDSDDCGKVFRDKEGLEEANIEDFLIPANGVHTGGQASCQHKAVCEVCGQEYGSLSAHAFTKEVVAEQYLVSAASCGKKAVYRYSCECGLAGDDTFEYGEPLDHNFSVIDNNYLNSACDICGAYKHIVEAENMRSNAWNTDDAEFRDYLWKTNVPNLTTGDFCVKRVYDNAVNNPNRVYLEFDASTLHGGTYQMYMRLALSSTSVPRNSWKVMVNGAEVTTEGNFTSDTDRDWDTETWHDQYYADITLQPGTNVVRMYIADDCRCNIDNITLVGEELANKHNLTITPNEGEGHHYTCADENCGEVSDSVACTFDQRIAAPEHLKEENTYFFSCRCGKNGTETFDVEAHFHEFHQQTPGLNDVKVCDCGMMERKFDLATSYSESWSEGTAKTDALWRQLSSPKSDLDSGNWISHINDVTHEGNHDDEYWIAIGVEHNEKTDITATLLLNAGINDGNWNNIVVRVNEVVVQPSSVEMNKGGWDNFTNSSFGEITLKAGITNTIRISPKQGCQMNWGYLQINSDVNTTQATEKLPDVLTIA